GRQRAQRGGGEPDRRRAADGDHRDAGGVPPEDVPEGVSGEPGGTWFGPERVGRNRLSAHRWDLPVDLVRRTDRGPVQLAFPAASRAEIPLFPSIRLGYFARRRCPDLDPWTDLRPRERPVGPTGRPLRDSPSARSRGPDHPAAPR